MNPAPIPLRLGAALAMAAVTVLLSVLPGVPIEGDTQFQWHLGAVPPVLQNGQGGQRCENSRERNHAAERFCAVTNALRVSFRR